MNIIVENLHREEIQYKNLIIQFNKKDLKKGILILNVPNEFNPNYTRLDLYNQNNRLELSPLYNTDFKITKTVIKFDFNNHKIKGTWHLHLKFSNIKRIG